MFAEVLHPYSRQVLSYVPDSYSDSAQYEIDDFSRLDGIYHRIGRNPKMHRKLAPVHCSNDICKLGNAALYVLNSRSDSGQHELTELSLSSEYKPPAHREATDESVPLKVSIRIGLPRQVFIPTSR